MFLKIGEFRITTLTTFHIYRKNFSQKSSNFLIFKKKKIVVDVQVRTVCISRLLPLKNLKVIYCTRNLLEYTFQHDIMVHCHLLVGSYDLPCKKVKRNISDPIRNCR